MSEDKLSLSINGTEIQVDQGTTILDAARSIGVEIPTFCYHDGLSTPANCRMCLVNTNKAPKLLPACYATCMDGMEVQTEDERTLKTRKATLEFILVHHPVDCPICDQAGECVLQDHYFGHSIQPSRIFSQKNKKPKATSIGPHVLLDAERCIVCTCCVRFCDEISGTRELQVVSRGSRSFITTFPEIELDNKYSMCTADVCPVGALTTKDFRFKMRVWMLKTANSVCSGCSRGCNIYVDHGQDEVQRYRPRINMDVNEWWMCDAGRLSYKEFQQDRITQASANGRTVSTNDAIKLLAEELLGFGDLSRLAIVPSLSSTNEDLFALSRWAVTVGAGRWYVGGRPDGDEDELLIRADKNPNRKGLTTITAAAGIKSVNLSALGADIDSGAVTGVLWVGHEHAVGADLLSKLGTLSLRAVLASNATNATSFASTVIPIRSFEEVDGTWSNFEGRVQRLHQAIDPGRSLLPLWQAVYRLARCMDLAEQLPAPRSARRLFEQMASQIQAFEGSFFNQDHEPDASPAEAAASL
jgi:NADH-quinone oxidoreductase subunit G